MKLSIEAQELLEYPVELSDAGHLHADGHEDVIYPVRAHATIRNATSDERHDAEAMAAGMGDGFVPYDELATRIAYYIVKARYEIAILAELEEYRDRLGDDIPSAHLEAILKVIV